jgi:hypothetical protein
VGFKDILPQFEQHLDAWRTTECWETFCGTLEESVIQHVHADEDSAKALRGHGRVKITSTDVAAAPRLDAVRKTLVPTSMPAKIRNLRVAATTLTQWADRLAVQSRGHCTDHQLATFRILNTSARASLRRILVHSEDDEWDPSLVRLLTEPPSNLYLRSVGLRVQAKRFQALFTVAAQSFRTSSRAQAKEATQSLTVRQAFQLVKQPMSPPLQHTVVQQDGVPKLISDPMQVDEAVKAVWKPIRAGQIEQKLQIISRFLRKYDR